MTDTSRILGVTGHVISSLRAVNEKWQPIASQLPSEHMMHGLNSLHGCISCTWHVLQLEVEKRDCVSDCVSDDHLGGWIVHCISMHERMVTVPLWGLMSCTRPVEEDQLKLDPATTIKYCLNLLPAPCPTPNRVGHRL